MEQAEHVAMGRAITAGVPVLMERWTKAARVQLHGREDTRRATLRNHLPQFLTELGEHLAEGGDLGDPMSLAMDHGGQRWEVAWHLPELIRDYALLRVVLTDYLVENLGRLLSASEVRTLNRVLDEAIALAVQVFTDHKEASLRRALSRLRHAIPVVSHELRNQVSPLGMVARVLKLRPNDPAAVTRASEMLERHSERMARLLEDLLDVSSILTDEISLRCSRSDLGELVRLTAEDARALLEEAQVTLTVQVPDSPVWAMIDGDRIAQAVGNLLHNASKYTPEGGKVQVALRARDGNAQITVDDTGAGIEPEELGSIFEPFVRGTAAPGESSDGKGVGLGLAIVARLVELHDGRVSASSKGAGSGSRFLIELPLPKD